MPPATLLLAVATLLTACGPPADSASSMPNPTPVEAAPTVSDRAATEPAADPTSAVATPTGDEQTLSGRLGGDAMLEGGCAWLDTGDQRWEISYPAGYAIAFDPVRLVGPDGPVAGEGDVVTVTGAPAEGVMTICQVGPVWQATAVSPG